MTRAGFRELAGERGIALHDYTFDDWRKDEETIDALWPGIEANLKRSGSRGLE